MRGFAYTQGKYLLENQKQTLLFVSVLAVFSITSWLAAAVLALITLRQGVKEGLILFGAAVLAHCASIHVHIPIAPALISSLLNFAPCFIAACVLRFSASWRSVSGAFFVQALVIMLYLQLFAPDLIMAQFVYFEALIKEIQPDAAMSQILTHINSENMVIFANYLLGVQALGIVLAAILSLVIARAVQSLIYYPGGFSQEFFGFRAQKIDLFFLIGMFFMAYNHFYLAINLLPLMLFYFLLTGISLSFNILTKEKPLRSLVLLIMPLILIPWVMFFVYIVFGSLDSVFNFRSYLHKQADKSI